MAAIAYNLKKYLKFIEKRVKSGAGQLALSTLVKSTFQNLFGTFYSTFKIGLPLVIRQEKSLLKELIYLRFFQNYRVVQRLPLLGTVFTFRNISQWLLRLNFRLLQFQYSKNHQLLSQSFFLSNH